MNFTLLNQSLEQNLFPVILILGVLLLLSLLLNILAMVKINNSNKKFQAMLNGSTGENLQEQLIANQRLIQELLASNEELKEAEFVNHRLFSGSLQKIALHRFSAFENMGGATSFALAVLDQNLDGFILSSIHSRQECRTYAKPISKGQAEYQLSAEEQQVLQEAIQK